MSAERHRRWALSWPCAVAAPAGRRAVWSGTFPPSRLPPRCSLPFPKISGASASRSLGPAPWRARLAAMRSVGPACAGGPGCAREGSHGSRGVRPPPAAARPLTRHLVRARCCGGWGGRGDLSTGRPAVTCPAGGLCAHLPVRERGRRAGGQRPRSAAVVAAPRPGAAPLGAAQVSLPGGDLRAHCQLAEARFFFVLIKVKFSELPNTPTSFGRASRSRLASLLFRTTWLTVYFNAKRSLG